MQDVYKRQPDSNDVVKLIEDAELRRKLSDAINPVTGELFSLSTLNMGGLGDCLLYTSRCV